MAEPCVEVHAGRNRHKRSVCDNCNTCFGCESSDCVATDGSGKRHKKSEGDPIRRPAEEQPQRLLPPRAATTGAYAEKPEMVLEFDQQPSAVGELFAALGLDSPGRKFAFLDEVNSNRQLQQFIGLLERTTATLRRAYCYAHSADVHYTGDGPTHPEYSSRLQEVLKNQHW